MAVPTASDARTWHYWNLPSATSSSKPMDIGSTRSTTSDSSSSDENLSSSLTSTRSSQHYACAFPSWPSGSVFKSPTTLPSSYVSDEDLFGLDDAPHMREAPAPPRAAEAWSRIPFAQHVLPRVAPPVALPTAEEQQRRRSSAGAKKTRTKRKSSTCSTASNKSKG